MSLFRNSLRRMHWQRIAGSFLILCGSLYFNTATAKEKPFNVLFIAVDDLNTSLGCYGREASTPHMDSLAESGLLFERAYCQEAVCAPSRASVLSGYRPDLGTPRIGRGSGGGPGLRENAPEVVTLPELFQKHGYHTVSIGKVFHHGEVETGGPVGPRMDRDTLSWSEEPWYHGTPYQQWYQRESYDLVEQMRALPDSERPRIIRGLPYEAADQPDEVYADGQIASQTILTLRRLKDRAFFLAVGFRRPHLPFNCPQKYWDLYPEDAFGLPDNFHHPKNAPEVALHDAYELRSYAGMPESGPIPEHHARNLVRGYLASISYVDAQVGRVLAELDELGLTESTLVVLWSDHGYHTGENGLWTKMTNFEIATRVPLLFRVPGLTRAGSRTNALVELVDLYPTLAELCRLKTPDYLEGRSFTPLLRNPQQDWKQAAFSHYRRGLDPREKLKTKPIGRSIVTQRYRYTEWTSQQGQRLGTELYDLQNDPGNNVNIAGQPGHGDLVESLSAQLHAGWRKASGKTF